MPGCSIRRPGRKAGTLLGQEVREWCIRARAAGVRGFYIPDMVVRHIIPASRLNKKYFRRWFYWRGISRAMLYERSGLDMEAPEDRRSTSASSRTVSACRATCFARRSRISSRRARTMLRGDAVAAFEHELWLWFFAGIVRQRWTDRHASRLALRPGNVPFTA